MHSNGFIYMKQNVYKGLQKCIGSIWQWFLPQKKEIECLGEDGKQKLCPQFYLQCFISIT